MALVMHGAGCVERLCKLCWRFSKMQMDKTEQAALTWKLALLQTEIGLGALQRCLTA